ncbi:hypothetical protein K3H47_11990 [Aeromonas veronii]|uniref:hypothetical protein n=1 Tax=Aeromonas veronii TaxID=654 RepID=UPI001F1AE4CD|nr:hypothetical protein [Aeromonas veronii]MCF5764662.1 hypothetical protein [Aeromonas veronii]
MKLKHAWIAALLSLSTTLTQAAEVTADVATAPGKANIVEAVSAQAKVTAIDMASRKVSLTNAAGEAFDIIAGEQVTNLANLKVGDTVALRYLQMLDLELIKGGAGVRQRIVEVAADKAGAGEKPGAGVARKVTLYGDVIAVDKAQQTITVKGVDHTLMLKVHDPAQLALIAKGDQIKAVQTQAVGIGIVPEKK